MPKIRRTRRGISYSQGATIPDGADVPDVEFEEAMPPIDVCDHALGRYMRAWGHVETEFFGLFTDLLGAHVSAARIIATSTIHAQTLREITGTLARQRLSSKESATLESLLRRLRDATTIRNRVVHGTWLVAVKVGGGKPNTASWERFYEPSDPDILKELSKKHPNQKVAAKHRFTVARIVTLAEESASLARDIRLFRERASIGPFPDMLPVAFSP